MYQFGVPLWLVRGEGTVNGLRAEGTGTSAANTFGGGIALAWDGLFGSGIGLQASTGINRTIAGFRSGEYTEGRVFDPVSGEIASSLYQLRVDQRGTALGAELRLAFTLDSRFVPAFGAWGEFLLADTRNYYLRRVAPLEAGETPYDSAIAEPADVGTARTFRFGPSVGAGYLLPLADALALRPEVALRLDAGALADGLGLRAVTLGAGLALLFDLSSEAPPLPPDDTPLAAASTPEVPSPREPVPPVELPAAPALAASIDLFAVGADGGAQQSATVQAELVRNIMRMPFPGTLYIDRGAGLDVMDSVAGPDGAGAFSLDALAAGGPLNVHARGLDLLGMRLKESGLDTITLQAPEGADESTAAQVEKIRGYLRDVWRVAPERVRTAPASQPQGRNEPKRLTVVPGKGRKPAPLVVEWRSLAYRLPAFDLKPVIRAQAGVRYWGITVRQGPQVITGYSSAGTTEEGSGTLYIPESRSGKPLQPLIAELAVQDSAGGTLVVYDTLALTLNLPNRAGDGDTSVPDRERQIFHLPPSTGSSNAALNESVRDLIPALRPGDHVTTRGPLADRLCDAIRTTVPARIRNLTFHADDSFARTPLRTEIDRIFAGWNTVVIERAVSRTVSNDNR